MAYIGTNLHGETPASNLVIPTHVSPTGGQSTHPSVVRFDTAWNGYKYWMAHTPYPAGNDDHEDPNLAVSNDGTNWIVAPGVTQPLDDADGAPEYNSDVNLALGPNNRLYLFWRNYDSSLPADQEKLYMRSSADGVTWSPKQLVWKSNVGTVRYVSPTFIWEDYRWKMWAVNIQPSPNNIIYREATQGVEDPTPTDWGAQIACSVGTMQPGKEAWHLSVSVLEAGYAMILNDCTVDASGTSGDLLVLESEDGLTWSGPGIPVLDRIAASKYDQLYKASMVPATRNGVDGYDVWYSAWLSVGPVWNIYRTFISPVTAPTAPGRVTPTLPGPFTNIAFNSITKVGGQATARFNGKKSGGQANAGVQIICVPPGFRTNENVWGFAWGLAGAPNPFPIYYDAGNHTIKVNAVLGLNQAIAFTLHWNITE